MGSEECSRNTRLPDRSRVAGGSLKKRVPLFTTRGSRCLRGLPGSCGAGSVSQRLLLTGLTRLQRETERQQVPVFDRGYTNRPRSQFNSCSKLAQKRGTSRVSVACFASVLRSREVRRANAGLI